MVLKIAPVPDELVRGADHPLIVATVNTLPMAGAPFPAAQRKAALAMIEMAFNVIYGTEGAMADGPRIVSQQAVPFRAADVPAPKRPHEQNGCDYYVDEQGLACCDVRRDNGIVVAFTPGRRVLAEEAEGHQIYEYRGPSGKRDRNTVTWADDTQGALPGMEFCGPG